MHRRAIGFQLQPLLVRQLAADAQKHAGVCFLQFGAGLSHAVDLGKKFSFVRRIGGHQGLHDCFFLLKRGELVNQFQPVSIENVVHLLLLISRQAEPPDEVGIVPPATWRSDVKAATRTSGAAWTTTARSAGALMRRTVRTARGGLLSKTGHSEQEGNNKRRYEVEVAGDTTAI